VIVSIDHIIATEDFNSVLYHIYRLESIRFESNQKEYRIAFLSYDISQCKEIIHQLESQDLLPDLVEIDASQLANKLEGIVFSQPLAIENYIVYQIPTGKHILSKEDKGFQRKMNTLGYEQLPLNICRNGNQYTIRYPERFIYKLWTSQ
jgi:hypothetical protein